MTKGFIHGAMSSFRKFMNDRNNALQRKQAFGIAVMIVVFLVLSFVGRKVVHGDGPEIMEVEMPAPVSSKTSDDGKKEIPPIEVLPADEKR